MGKANVIGAALATGLAGTVGYAVYHEGLEVPVEQEITAQNQEIGQNVLTALNNNPSAILEVDSQEEYGRLQSYMSESGQSTADLVMAPDFVHTRVIEVGDSVAQDPSAEIVKNDLEAKPLDGPLMMLVARVKVEAPGQLENLSGIGPDKKPLFTSSSQDIHEITMQNPLFDVTSKGISLTSQDENGHVVRLQLSYKDFLKKIDDAQFLLNGQRIDIPDHIATIGGVDVAKKTVDETYKSMTEVLAKSFGDRSVIISEIMGESPTNGSRSDIQRATDPQFAKVIGRLGESRQTSPEGVNVGTVVFHGGSTATTK